MIDMREVDLSGSLTDVYLKQLKGRHIQDNEHLETHLIHIFYPFLLDFAFNLPYFIFKEKLNEHYINT